MPQGSQSADPGKPFDLANTMGSIERAIKAGSLDEAERLCDQVLHHRPEFPPAMFLLAMTVLRRGEESKAIELLRKAASAEPKAMQAMDWLAKLLREQGELDEAEFWSGRLVRQWPNFPGGFAASGQCQFAKGKIVEARDSFAKAVQLAPSDAQCRFNLARTLEALLQPGDAVREYRCAVSLAPAVAPYHESLGKLLATQGQSTEAVAHLKAALGLAANASTALHLAIALANNDQFDEAESYFEQAVGLEPNWHAAYEMWATNLQVRGCFEEAANVLRKAIDIDPSMPGPYLSLVSIETVSPEDDKLVGRLEQEANDASRGKNDLRQFNYALAKAYVDLGKDAQAMTHYDRGNQLAFETLLRGQPFNEKAHAEWGDQQISFFYPKMFSGHAVAQHEAVTPIFVVGMIRSGTTLAEQILSCHPEIAGAGEISYWSDPIRLELWNRWMAGKIDAGELDSVRQNYLELIQSIGFGRNFIIDKMPLNYLSLGPIHLLFPNARIIHCRRDPIDTCLSIYMTPFPTGAAFCFDRMSIVSAYQQYERLMLHWRSVLPKDRFLEIDYEAIVDNREGVTREMLEFCGVGWNDACLRPEENRRAVQTPSRWQVRQPIYTTSTQKWRRWEPWLREFAVLAR